MRVLVTGGAGFIGSHTVDMLLQRGHTVRVLDALAPPVHDGVKPPAYLSREVEFILGDVRSPDAWLRALDGMDGVFHFAAYQDYMTDFSKFFDVNAVGTALLYETIVSQGVPVQKIVVASSQAAYGEGKYLCRHHRAADAEAEGAQVVYPSWRSEDQLRRRDWNVHCPVCGAEMEWTLTDEAHVDPHNQYAISKYTQEILALNLGQRYNIPTVALRYSIVQGARQSFHNAYSGILRNFTQRLMVGQPPICYEDGQQVRDYVSVGDVARANMMVFEDARANYQVYNVGGRSAVSVLEYAELLARKINPRIEPQVPGLYRFGDTRHIVSSVTKLASLGWEPSKGIGAIADEHIAWVSTQSDLRDYYAAAHTNMMATGTLRAAS